MAEIICNKKEFHKFIGPRIRNKIQSLTKKRKNEINFVCQHCGKSRELESAHKKGKGRKDIIEELLLISKVEGKNDLFKVDLEIFEQKIIESHKPLENYFLFLCSKCHIEYDSQE